MKENHYRRLGIMAALSFVAMYGLMYAMVDSFDHVYLHINQFYMAGLMAAPMVLIELVVMRGMSHDKRLNTLIAGASVMVGLLMFVFIQQQNGGVRRPIPAIDDPAPFRRNSDVSERFFAGCGDPRTVGGGTEPSFSVKATARPEAGQHHIATGAATNTLVGLRLRLARPCQRRLDVPFAVRHAVIEPCDEVIRCRASASQAGGQTFQNATH